MNAPALTREEGLGLALAALGHAALVWVLVTAKPPEALPPVERISVTLSEELGAVSTSPDPTANPAPDTGPELGEPAPAPEPVPAPQPQSSAVPPPRPASAAKTPPKPPQQAQKASTKWPFAPPQQATKTPTKTPPGKPGASVLDPNYGKGITGGTGMAKTPPAVATGQQKSSWSSSIGGKVAARLRGCGVSGLDIERLYFDVTFTLTSEGKIQSIGSAVPGGITPANRTQVAPMKACVIKAIQLAAPFAGLPVEYYNDWKVRNMRLRMKEQ